jgi:hypothetical protein
MSDFIPNSFQVPNAYIDRIWHLLTPPEQSVLIYMARRIFGFGRRQDRISLSQFTGGTRSRKDGRALDGGTGLGRAALETALSGLSQFCLVRVVEPAVPAQQLAPLYELQLDSGQIDLAGLESRFEAKKEVGRAKIERMKEASENGTYADRQHRGYVGGQQGGYADGQQHNNQGETQLEKQGFPFKEEFSVSNSSAYRQSFFDFDESDFDDSDPFGDNP